jgi:hypothetical protein
MKCVTILALLLFASPLFGQTITTQPASQTVQVGQSASFTVTVSGGPCRSFWLINGAGSYGPVASTFTYTFSNVTLSQNGTTIQIQIYGCPGSGNSESTKAILTVVPAAPTLQSIAIAPIAPTIGIGSTEPFTATGTYSDGSTQNLTSTATWTSGTPTIATVSSAGLATALTAGTSVIQAASGSVIGSTVLDVMPVLNITFTPTNEDGSTPSATLAVSSVITNADGTTTTTGILQLSSGTGLLLYNSTLLYEAVFLLNGNTLGQPTVFSPTLLTAIIPTVRQMTFSAVLCVTTCPAGDVKSMSWGVQ